MARVVSDEKAGKDGKWHYTEGLPARPFMYMTSLELQNEVVKIAQEIFGK